MAQASYDRPGFSVDDQSDFDDGYRGFDPREESNGRGPLILALAGGVLVVFGAVVWNTYAKGVRLSDDGVPVILADKGEIKRKPADTVAMVQPDLSRRVYDQMESSPAESLPEAVGVSMQRVPDSDPQLVGGPPMELRPGLDAGEEVAPDRSVEAEVEALRGDLPVADAPAETASLGEARALTPEPGPAPEVSLPSAPPVETPKPRFVFVEGGPFLVQLAALRSEDAAFKAWEQAALRQPDVFRGASRIVQRADLGAKGVFYRLRVGSFAARDSAMAFCDAIKAGGGSCIIVER